MLHHLLDPSSHVDIFLLALWFKHLVEGEALALRADVILTARRGVRVDTKAVNFTILITYLMLFASEARRTEPCAWMLDNLANSSLSP